MITIKEIFFLNEIGQRPQLEDAIYPMPGSATTNDRLFMVCDGVGGELMGEEASRIACEAFSDYMQQHPPADHRLSKDYIAQAQQAVVQKMLAYSDKHPGAKRMATTLALVYIGDHIVSVAWCGDSRIYHVRDGKILWRSTDHSWVSDMVRFGEIAEEEAQVHPRRNVITRSLNPEGNASDIDIHQLEHIQNSDYIMLCTDGLLEQIDENGLSSILTSDSSDKISLFRTYTDGKTKDNFSLYLLRLTAPHDAPVRRVKPGVLVIGAILAVLCCIAFFFRGDFFSQTDTGKKDSLEIAPPRVSHPVNRVNESSGPDPANLPQIQNTEQPPKLPLHDPAQKHDTIDLAVGINKKHGTVVVKLNVSKTNPRPDNKKKQIEKDLSKVPAINTTDTSPVPLLH